MEPRRRRRGQTEGFGVLCNFVLAVTKLYKSPQSGCLVSSLFFRAPRSRKCVRESRSTCPQSPPRRWACGRAGALGSCTRDGRRLARALAARTLTGATRHVGSACVVIGARSHVGSGQARGDGVARLQRTRERAQRGSPKRRARGGRARMTAARARVGAVNYNQLTMRTSAARARRTAGYRYSAAFSENTRPSGPFVARRPVGVQ